VTEAEVEWLLAHPAEDEACSGGFRQVLGPTVDGRGLVVEDRTKSFSGRLRYRSCGVPAQDADYGEMAQPGFLGRLFGRRPTIVKEANLAAATASLPQGAGIIGKDPNGHWIAYEMPNGAQQVRFRASAAWLPNEPTVMPNYTNITLATVHEDARLVVLEGIHRTRAMAREKVMVDPSRGGVEQAPGWLDFSYDPAAFRDTPSARAIAELLGGDPDSPLVPAR
jgi:hypothetical protein